MKYIITEERSLSWSAIASFEYDPEQWYEAYILGRKQSSKEMTFGSMVDKRLQDDATYLPHVPRYPYMQYKMNATLDGLPLVGVPDGTDAVSVLADYKTGRKPWDQKRADETGQLTFYALLLYLTEKRKPEDFEYRIHWLPTAYTDRFKIDFQNPENPECITFYTKRTMVGLAKFGQRIKNRYAEMQAYVEAHA